MNTIGEKSNSAEVAEPQDIDSMTEMDFEKYMEGAREVGILREQSELSSPVVTLESERSESDKRNFKTVLQDGTLQSSEGVAEGMPTDGEETAEPEEGVEVQDADEGGNDNGEAGEPREPFKVYQSQEEYQKEFDEAFSKRFKNYKHTEKIAGTFNELLPVFSDLYGTEDMEVIKKMIADDHARVMAERNNVSEDEFKQTFNEKVQSDRERRELADLKEQLQAQQQVNGWRAEAIDVKKLYPEFDLDRQYTGNNTFKEYLLRGLSVSDAYLLSNKDEILKKPKPNPAKHNRIPEGNVVPAGTSAPLTVDEMDDDMFRKYMDKVRDMR